MTYLAYILSNMHHTWHVTQACDMLVIYLLLITCTVHVTIVLIWIHAICPYCNVHVGIVSWYKQWLLLNLNLVYGDLWTNVYAPRVRTWPVKVVNITVWTSYYESTSHDLRTVKALLWKSVCATGQHLTRVNLSHWVGAMVVAVHQGWISTYVQLWPTWEPVSLIT